MKRALVLAVVCAPIGALLLLISVASLAGVGMASPGSPGSPGASPAPPSGPAAPELTGGPPSWFALSDIPPTMLAIYQQGASSCPGLPWSILAGIGKLETDHGRNVHPSSAGALGPMQFIPSTWAEYGVDADFDGVGAIADPADSVTSAARYLCANGGGTRSGWWTAIWNYNHDPNYVALVFGLAARYEGAPPPVAH